MPIKPSQRGQEYGFDRDISVAFGRMDVSIAKDVSWGERIALGRGKDRNKQYIVTCDNITQIDRSPATPKPSMRG